MSLNIAYDIARSGLSSATLATSTASRNIANADNPNSSQKSVKLVSAPGNGVRIDAIQSSIDEVLFESVLSKSSLQAESSTIAAALDKMNEPLSGADLDNGPASKIGLLKAALQTASATPNDYVALQGVLHAAKDVVSSLNSSASEIANVRNDANSSVVDGVQKLHELLQQFQLANNSVTSGEAQGKDITDELDSRNMLLRAMSELIEIHAVVRDNNDMVLFAANGATLFEKVPRNVSVDGLEPAAVGQPGAAIRIDGIPFVSGTLPRLGGKLGAEMEVRDKLAITYGQQLDEIARALINSFSETSQSGSAPAKAGLFTYPNGPFLSSSNTVLNGLASVVRINDNADPSEGGDLDLIRDGGISDPSYRYNSTDATGFTDRINQVIDGMMATQSFDAGAGLQLSTDLLSFSASHAGWLQGVRKEAAENDQNNAIGKEHAISAWQNKIGINLDAELSSLISLQRSYQASAKLLTTVNDMFGTILSAVR